MPHGHEPLTLRSPEATASSSNVASPRPHPDTPRAAVRSHRSLADPMRSLRVLPVLVCLVWAGNVVAVRASARDLSAIEAVTARGILATGALLCWAWTRRKGERLTMPPMLPILLVSVLIAAHFALLYVALARTTASHVAILLYLYPVVTAAFAHRWLSGERLTLRRASGLVLGLSGAAMTMSDVTALSASSSLLGDFLALGSAVVWAAGTTYTKRALSAVSPVSLALYPTVISTLGLGLYLVAGGYAGPPRVTMTTVLALAYQGILVGALSKVMWLALLRRYPASELAAFTFLTPALGVLAGVLVLGEPFSPRVVGGLALVVVALLVIQPRPDPSSAGRVPTPLGGWSTGASAVSQLRPPALPGRPGCERE